VRRSQLARSEAAMSDQNFREDAKTTELVEDVEWCCCLPWRAVLLFQRTEGLVYGQVGEGFVGW
jgi:hypothetical protein